MPTIDLPTNDVTWSSRGGDSLHCLTKDSLDVVLKTLGEMGYTIEDNRTGSHSLALRDGITPEMMEECGFSIYFASLEVRMGKCGTCHQYIETCGIRKHGHQCEKCGAVTYLEITDGSQVEFVFTNDGQGWMQERVLCTAKRWDIDKEELYLRPSTDGQERYGRMSPDKAHAYMEQFSDKWERVVEDGVELIKIHHPWSWRLSDDDVIQIRDVFGHMHNHKIIRLWEGKEYPENGHNFPVPETISIYLDYLKK